MQQAVVKQQVKENYSMSDEKLKFNWSNFPEKGNPCALLVGM